MNTLSIVIPIYNEVKTLEDLINRVRAVEIPFTKELLLVDDGSTDGTRDLLARLAEDDDLKVVLHDKNRGKGAALHSGFARATGDLVMVQDADLEYDPQDYPKLLQPFLDGKADVVYGSRFAGGECHRALAYWHAQGNHFITRCSNMFSNLRLTDMETCYKVFKREIIQGIELHEERFGFEPEITAKIARRRLHVYEVGISYDGRSYEEGKKIGWRDGCRAIWCILKYNLWSR